LKTTYGEGWETFVSSAAVKMFMASECLTTREFVSKLSGIKTVKVPSYSSGSSTPGIGWPPKMPTTSKNEGISISEVAQPVLHPHEVGNIPPDEMVMRVRGVENLIRCKRKPYWECPELKGYDPDPYETGE
jgi:type IV secretory pathway TraG/TraD family ATPase VirD4